MDKTIKRHLFSIIIPIYKVEQYLNECVDSILNQSFFDYEIILVDDGSPDNCPKICDDYASKHNFIKVIHKPNGGLSSARNAGIRVATGRYIIFMDSDDWWNPDVDVNSILDDVNNHPETEMFLFSSLDYVEGEGLYKRTEHEQLSNIRTDSIDHYYSDLLANGNLEVHAATKIIKREFLIENNLFFKEGITSEDNEWMLRLLRVLKSVKIIDYPLYMYRTGRVGSITNTIKRKNISDVLDIIQASINYYGQLEVSKELLRYEYCYCAYLWFCALGLSVKIPKREYQDLIAKFKATAVVCEYSNSKKTKLAYFVYKLLGMNGVKNILGLYIKLKGETNLNKKKLESV